LSLCQHAVNYDLLSLSLHVLLVHIKEEVIRIQTRNTPLPITCLEKRCAIDQHHTVITTLMHLLVTIIRIPLASAFIIQMFNK